MEFQATKVNIKNNILTITLNRPEKKNALNNVMMNELNYAFAYAKQEREIRVVVVDAEGDIFCAGADLRLAKEDSNVPKIEGADDISFSLRRLHKPVICKIQGSVLAGALLILTNATHALSLIHISEPTRLRRISYAVFCLKKKKQKTNQHQDQN